MGSAPAAALAIIAIVEIRLAQRNVTEEIPATCPSKLSHPAEAKRNTHTLREQRGFVTFTAVVM